MQKENKMSRRLKQEMNNKGNPSCIEIRRGRRPVQKISEIGFGKKCKQNNWPTEIEVDKFRCYATFTKCKAKKKGFLEPAVKNFKSHNGTF